MKNPIVPMQHDSLVSEHEKAGVPAQPFAQSKSNKPSISANAAAHIWLVRSNHVPNDLHRSLLPSCVTRNIAKAHGAIRIKTDNPP
jgi:hypothetical protein